MMEEFTQIHHTRTDDSYTHRYEKYPQGKRERHGTRAMTKFKKHHFVAWDGEGIGDLKRPDILTDTEIVRYQLYALLMNNEGVSVTDIEGIPTVTCLETLLNASDDKFAIHVCFGASYDTNMMLHGVSKDIPEEDLRKLQKGQAIDFGIYQLKYIPHKVFEVRRYASIHQKYFYNKKTHQREGWFEKSFTLWDVFGFFQSSFVLSLEKYFCSGNQLPGVKEYYTEVINQIEIGKKKRGAFTVEELESFVTPYCKLEVDALEQLMQKLHSYLLQSGIEITRWDGAGAIAAAMLDLHNVKEHIQESLLPFQVVQAAEYAFFGGRIETLQYGNYERKIHHADINSAYPAEQVDIPSFLHGTWEHMHEMGNAYVKYTPKVTLFLVSWRAKAKHTIIGPFPWRSPKGNVYFPPRGMGWVWKPEVEMCLDTMASGPNRVEVYIHEAWSFFPTSDILPYEFIRDAYTRRQELVKNGEGAEKVYKLGLNSLYGKTAQSVGYDIKKNKKPPYHNLAVAGLVTSGVRAKMMRVAMQNPRAVIMLATDGIYSTAPMQVDGKGKSDKVLGEWEYSIHKYITIVASGVYFYKTEGREENAFSRGFDAYTVMRDYVLEAWERGEKFLQCKTTRFVGLGSACGLNNFDLWCTWRTIERTLGLNMDTVAKRDDAGTGVNPRYGLVRTYAHAPGSLALISEQSFPYDWFPSAMSHKTVYKWDENTSKIDGIPMRMYLQEVANTLS